MANRIRIKRSTTTATPADDSLQAGELAYSSSSGKLFIGHPDGTTSAPQHIGYLQPVEGTLTAQKPIVTDSNSKIDRLNVDNLRLDGNTITSEDTNGNITITPNGTGDIVLDGQNWPQADGSANQYLKTDGSGQLSWAAIPSGSFTISDNAGTPNTDTFTTGGTLTFEGSTGITTTVSDDNIAIAITAGGVDTTQLADSAVETAKINDGAVTNAKMAANSVDSDQYVDGSVDNVHLAGSIANGKLANSSVTVGSTAISLGSTATTIDGLNTLHGIDGSGTDAAGTNLTIKAGGGTGTGAGGSMLFQVADGGGSSGSGANSFATALTIADDKTVTAGGNVVVSGNLTVSGTTTTVNSETVTFDDNILVLNNNYTGSSPTENAGFEVERGTVANVALRWNETSDKWQLTEDGSAYKNIHHVDSVIDGGSF